MISQIRPSQPLGPDFRVGGGPLTPSLWAFLVPPPELDKPTTEDLGPDGIWAADDPSVPAEGRAIEASRGRVHLSEESLLALAAAMTSRLQPTLMVLSLIIGAVLAWNAVAGRRATAAQAETLQSVRQMLQLQAMYLFVIELSGAPDYPEWRTRIAMPSALTKTNEEATQFVHGYPFIFNTLELMAAQFAGSPDYIKQAVFEQSQSWLALGIWETIEELIRQTDAELCFPYLIDHGKRLSRVRARHRPAELINDDFRTLLDLPGFRRASCCATERNGNAYQDRDLFARIDVNTPSCSGLRDSA